MKRKFGSVLSGPVEDSFMGSVPHDTVAAAAAPAERKREAIITWEAIIVMG